MFKRGKKNLASDQGDSATETEANPDDQGNEGETVVEPGREATSAAAVSAAAADDDASVDAELDVAALDAQDWRTEGPFDDTEVELDTDEHDQARIDLGSMILTGFPGAELRLQVAEGTEQVISAMLIHGDSALELGAYAAPRSGGLWSELRNEISEAAVAAGGSAGLVEGPFGVELRRLLPVTAPDGSEGYQPSRMWVAEGSRWLLRGIVYGQAAMEEGADGSAADLVGTFREVVIRRGEAAVAPGDLLPLTLPDRATVAGEV